MKSLLWSLSLVLVAAGCQPGTSGNAGSFAGDTFVRPASGVGQLNEGLTVGDGPNGAHIIFLNFDGQTLKHASNYTDDPDTGASWMVNSTVNFPAFDASPYQGQFTADQAKQNIVNYFKTFYAPFNVQVVTSRPTSGARYTMCMVGGLAEQVLGSSAGNAAGVAPLDCGNMNESEITYAFAASIAPDQTGLSLTQTLKSIAVTAAQETAHSYGLNHTDDTTDIMYPQLDPAQNQFVDANNNLIQNSSVCSNTGSQNSKQMLIANIGSGNGMPVGNLPTVSFVTPKNGDTIPLDFTIIVNASETGGSITKVSVDAGGQNIFSATAPPYRSSLSTSTTGQVQLTATAYDAAGNFQSTSVNFTLSSSAPAQQLPPCTGNSDCQAGQVCTSGMCVSAGPGSTTSSGGTTSSTGSTTSSGTGSTTSSGGTTSSTGSTTSSSGGILMGIATGADCTEDAQCQSGICDTRSGHKYCTAICNPVVNNSSCPAGLICVADSGQHLCQKPSSGGCQAAPGSPIETAFGFFLVLGLFALLRLRRTVA